MSLWSNFADVTAKLAETAKEVLTEEPVDDDDAPRGVTGSVSVEQSEELQKQLDEALQDVEKLTMLCEKQKLEITRLREEEQNSSSQIQDMQQELSIIKTKLRTSELDHEGLKKRFQEETKKKDAELQELRSRVAAAESEAQEQKKRADAVAAAVARESGNGESAEKDAAIISMRMQIEALAAQLQQERESTSEEHSQEVASVKEAREEARRERERSEEAEKQAIQFKEKAELLRVHLLEREEEMEQWSRQTQELRDALNVAQGELGQLREERKEWETLAEQMEQKEAHCKQLERALANLDEAVSQMTEDHRQEMHRREKMLKEKYADEYNARLGQREREAEGVVSAMKAKAEALEGELSRVMVAVLEKDKKIDSLMGEIGPLREALTEAMRKLTEAIDKDQFAVDKRLVANLLASYFTNDKKDEVLCLMLRVLDVPKATRDKIYSHVAGGWFGRRKFSEDESADADKSVGDMWVEFLLKEAEKDK